MKEEADFDEFQKRVNVLDENIKVSALEYGAEIFAKKIVRGRKRGKRNIQNRNGMTQADFIGYKTIN